MQIYRRTYVAPLALTGMIAFLLVACSDETPTAVPASTPGPTAEVVVETPTPDAAPDRSADSPTATRSPGSRSTPTPTPEPEETPVSETESIGFYLRGFNSIGRGEYVEAERTFTTVS